MENIYNRLVRDNIPDICISNNQKSKFRELDDLKYVSALNEELKEEVLDTANDTQKEEIQNSQENIENNVEAVHILLELLKHLQSLKEAILMKFENKRIKSRK